MLVLLRSLVVLQKLAGLKQKRCVDLDVDVDVDVDVEARGTLLLLLLLVRYTYRSMHRDDILTDSFASVSYRTVCMR